MSLVALSISWLFNAVFLMLLPLRHLCCFLIILFLSRLRRCNNDFQFIVIVLADKTVFFRTCCFMFQTALGYLGLILIIVGNILMMWSRGILSLLIVNVAGLIATAWICRGYHLSLHFVYSQSRVVSFSEHFLRWLNLCSLNLNHAVLGDVFNDLRAFTVHFKGHNFSVHMLLMLLHLL